MNSSRQVLLLLGGDMGDVPKNLDQAAGAIERNAGKVLARSRDHWTSPWGFAGPHLFLNRALLLETTLDPMALMDTLLKIEADLGRIRTGEAGYASRTVDIDILLMGDSVLQIPSLTVPHPRMHERRFALAPAADVAPLAVHPVLQRTILELLNDLRPPSSL